MSLSITVTAGKRFTSTELVDKAKEKGWTRTGAYEHIKQLTADNKIRQVSGLIYKSITPIT